MAANFRALTLHQPYASLIADGRERYAGKSWSTEYRGRLLIHSAKKRPNYLDFQHFNYCRDELQLGAILCIAELTDCIQVTADFISTLSHDETMAGFHELSCYAWKFESIKPVAPIKCNGRRGLWIPDNLILRSLFSQNDFVQLSLDFDVEEFKKGQSVATPDGNGSVYWVDEIYIWVEIGNVVRPFNREVFK